MYRIFAQLSINAVMTTTVEEIHVTSCCNAFPLEAQDTTFSEASGVKKKKKKNKTKKSYGYLD